MSLCNALAYNTKDFATGLFILQVLIIYDVACQFYKKFKQRWDQSAILQQIYGWFILSMIWAVGKFHLGAHKPICYPNFSLNHTEGAGQAAGETMEPLWSKLNLASITARAMSLAHREEYIILVMLDMNWKVIIRFSEMTLLNCMLKSS